MKKAKACPKCQHELKKWDNTRQTEMKISALNSTVGQVGFWGFIISLMSSWLIYQTDEKESVVWKCINCNQKFTGNKLKPFDWSDYQN